MILLVGFLNYILRFFWSQGILETFNILFYLNIFVNEVDRGKGVVTIQHDQSLHKTGRFGKKNGLPPIAN